MTKEKKPTATTEPKKNPAVEAFLEVMRKDPDLERAWKDSIAMSLKDAWQNDFNDRGLPTTSERIDKVANEGAKLFMNLLLAGVPPGQAPKKGNA